MTLRCAFLTTDNLEDFFVYDDLVKPHLRDLGWDVSDVSWRDATVNYNHYDLIIVRSTWDYQSDCDAFVACLENIEKADCQLENTLALMHWNIAKTYLKTLSEKGVNILPTLWCDMFEFDLVNLAFAEFNCDEIVIKPVISANADDTFRLSKQALREQQTWLTELFDQRPFMIQKFETSILSEGETSLFYFDGEFSHAIAKKPEDGDFRVQEEHGGQLFSITPTSELLVFAQAVIDALPESALYARIDVLNTDSGPALIEVELIEPSLYFNMDEHSAQRFANAIHQRYASKSGMLPKS